MSYIKFINYVIFIAACIISLPLRLLFLVFALCSLLFNWVIDEKNDVVDLLETVLLAVTFKYFDCFKIEKDKSE